MAPGAIRFDGHQASPGCGFQLGTTQLVVESGQLQQALGLDRLFSVAEPLVVGRRGRQFALGEQKFGEAVPGGPAEGLQVERPFQSGDLGRGIAEGRLAVRQQDPDAEASRRRLGKLGREGRGLGAMPSREQLLRLFEPGGA